MIFWSARFWTLLHPPIDVIFWAYLSENANLQYFFLQICSWCNISRHFLTLSSPPAKRAGPKFLSAESARAVTGRLCPHSGEGEDFLTGQPDFFYENCCNSRTESRKIDPKVGNERSGRGLKMGHWPKLGSYGKNRIFGPNTEILGSKKGTHFLTLTMFLQRSEKVIQRKKVPLPK